MAFDCQNLSPSAHLASVGVLFWSKIGSVWQDAASLSAARWSFSCVWTSTQTHSVFAMLRVGLLSLPHSCLSEGEFFLMQVMLFHRRNMLIESIHYYKANMELVLSNWYIWQSFTKFSLIWLGNNATCLSEPNLLHGYLLTMALLFTAFE
jgi:hypothetical protein